MPVSASTADLLCTVRLVDKSTGTSVVYHPCLALSHIQTVAAAADPNDADSTMPASRGLVVSCQLDTNRHHIVGKGRVPLRYPGRRPVRSWSQTCSELEFGLSSSELAAR